MYILFVQKSFVPSKTVRYLSVPGVYERALCCGTNSKLCHQEPYLSSCINRLCCWDDFNNIFWEQWVAEILLLFKRIRHEALRKFTLKTSHAAKRWQCCNFHLQQCGHYGDNAWSACNFVTPLCNNVTQAGNNTWFVYPCGATLSCETQSLDKILLGINFNRKEPSAFEYDIESHHGLNGLQTNLIAESGSFRLRCCHDGSKR